MIKFLSITLMLASFASGAIRTMGLSGTYQTFATAFGASSPGDSIQIVSAADTAITMTAAISPTLRIAIMSSPGRFDTIQCEPDGFKLIDPTADSTYLYNLCLAYINAPPVGTSFLRDSYSSSSGRGGVRDSNVLFLNKGSAATGVNCFDYGKSAGHIYEHNRMVDCRIEGFGAYTYTFDLADTSLMPNFTVTRCVFENSAFRVPHRSTFTFNKVRYDGESSLCGGDPSTVTYNFFSNLGGANENVTMDNARGLNGWIIHHNVYDSCSHVKLSIDGARNMEIHHERFDTTFSATYDLYTHSSSAAYDSCYNLTISNCYFKNGYNIAADAIHHDWLNLRGLLMLGGTDLMTDSAFYDTLRNCVWLGGPKGTIGQIYIPLTSDTLSGVSITSAVIEGARYPFLIQKEANPLVVKLLAGDSIGPLLYLTNVIDTAGTAIVDTGFSAICSLSVDYWWDNPVLRDSATVYLQDSTVGGWVTCDSSVGMNAGQRDTLVFTGGSAATTYRYRFVTKAIAGGVTFYDTSYSYAVTTTGSGACTDSVTHLGSRSTTTTINDSAQADCARDTILALFDTDTSSGPFDTTRFLTVVIDSVLKLSKTGLIESTDYFVKWVDSNKVTPWYKITTVDSVDQDTIPFCAAISITEITGPDSVQVGDTLRVVITNGKSTGQTATIGGTATTISYASNTLDSVVCPSVALGLQWLKISDSCGYADSIQVTVYEIPDTFTVTISITGNHLTEPDIDTTPFTADGRYETGTEITITATQAALHKLVPTATFQASPLIFTITRDTTIIIQSDTFPKFTRDTIISGGHATVAVAPATLTPVDSATACTTSVPAVDEGWRVDSIVHYSGGARVSAVTYPATQITYLIIANTIDSIFTSEIPAAQYTLTMATIGSGTVTPSAGDTTVDSASGFAITATPGVGYTFTGWTVVSGTILFNPDSSRCSLSTDATLRATFTIKTYTLTVTDNGAGGTTTPAGAVSVDSGVGTAIQADTATGYRFVRWDTTGVVAIADIYDASTACTLHSGNATVTAIFYYNILGLRADTVIYTSDSTIRAVYHFNASPQLSDWDTVGGVSMSVSDGAMSLTGGSANLRGVQWKRHIAATSIQCYLSVGSGYRATYAGINENNDGSTHLINPACGHLWGVTATEGYWIRDGATPGSHGLDAATTNLKFNIFEKYPDSTRVNLGRTAFWDVRSETNTFDTSKTIFIGAAYGNTVVIDSVVIDGWIYTEVTHYSITASVNPALSGTIDLSSDSVEAGQPCTATVTPAAGYVYLGVSGDANDTGRQVVFTMTEDKTIQFNLVNDSAMVLLIKTDNTGTSGDSSFTMPVNAVSTNWRWYSGDGFDTSTTATLYTHKFPETGVYRIGFIHNNANGFSNPLFNNGGDRLKVLDLQRFGKNRCDALNRSFYGCEYMTISARDTLVSATVGSAELAFYGIAADTLPRLILPNCVTFIQFIAYDTNLVYIDTVYAPAGKWWQNAFDGCKKQKYFRGVHTDAGENFSAFLRNNTALDSAKFSMAAANAMTEMCDGDSVMQKLIVTDDLSAVTVAGSAFAGCQLYTPSRDYNWNSLIDGSFLWRACSSFTYVNDSFPVAKNLMEIVVECRNISSLRLFAPVCTSFWYGAHNCIDLDTVDIINDSCRDYRYGFSHTSENGHEFDVFTISNDMKTMNSGTSCFEYNTLPTATYSELIDSLASLNTKTGVTFHGGSSIYLHSVQDERDTLTVARSWTITDGGSLGYTVTATDIGNGTHGFVGDSVSDPGSTVTIYPIPDAGNVFIGYSGDTSGIVLSGDTATFIMSEDRSVTLTFEPDTVSLTLTIVGTGSVDTLPSGKGGLFQALELCTLIAVYTPPDTVVTWSGASSGHADTVIITMDTDKSVTATFSSGEGTATRRRIWGGFTPSFGWGWR